MDEYFFFFLLGTVFVDFYGLDSWMVFPCVLSVSHQIVFVYNLNYKAAYLDFLWYLHDYLLLIYKIFPLAYNSSGWCFYVCF